MSPGLGRHARYAQFFNSRIFWSRFKYYLANHIIKQNKKGEEIPSPVIPDIELFFYYERLPAPSFERGCRRRPRP